VRINEIGAAAEIRLPGHAPKILLELRETEEPVLMFEHGQLSAYFLDVSHLGCDDKMHTAMLA